jgi:hypothetical protein
LRKFLLTAQDRSDDLFDLLDEGSRPADMRLRTDAIIILWILASAASFVAHCALFAWMLSYP